MKSKTSTKKTAKFEFTRKELAERLENVLEELRAVDTTGQAPVDVTETIEQQVNDLQEILDDLNSRA